VGDEMLDGLSDIFVVTLSLQQVIVNLVVAFISGFLISIIYRLTNRGVGYTRSFIDSLVVLSMITSVVIMVIGNNLARAFGLVGAMSIIRFRTAVKDIQDIVFIFFALTAGMASGVGLHILSIVGVIIIGITLVIFSKRKLLLRPFYNFLVQFHFSGDIEKGIPPYQKILDKYCKSYKLINVRSTGRENEIELSYYIHLKKDTDQHRLFRELNAVSGIENLNFYYDEENV